MCRRLDLITLAKVIVPQEWIEKLVASGLLNLLRTLHFGRSPKLNVVVKVFLSFVHEGYLWLDIKIDLNVNVIHRITGLSKVGRDPRAHFIGKNLERKLAMDIMKETKATKGMKCYDSIVIHDQDLRFTVQLLARGVLRKCWPNEVLVGAIDLAA